MPAIVQLVNLSLSVGSTPLFENVNAHVIDGQRVALVGRNGCGKSTLLRALSGLDSEDYFTLASGSIEGASAGEVLHVQQDNLQWSRLLCVSDLGISEEELRQMTLPDALDMATASGDDAALEDADSWRRLSVAAHKALDWKGAGYDTTPLGQLSPGCAMRAYLGVALHRRCIRLLLLDEPTNHLDLPSILWLQHAILASGKALVVASHDGMFLDAIADHLWHIDDMDHSIAVSGSKYSAYQHARQLALEQQKAAYEAQGERHKRLTAVADKLRIESAAGSKHMAKDNDKLQRDFKRDRAGRSGQKAKAIESRRDGEEKIEKVVDHAPLHISIEPIGAGSDASIMLDSCVLGYGDVKLALPPISLRVDFGERIAIVGYNGAGKSTLLRTIMRTCEPLEGHVTVGRELRIGNLTQEHETLPWDKTPREYVSELTGRDLLKSAGTLISYGLTLRQVDCPIGSLNPGARARALLATFSLRQVNALILDEPTNHLDIEAINEVTATLNSFTGTVLVVSHSRAFLQSLRLRRTLRLSSTGLSEVRSLESFIGDADEAAQDVVEQCFHN
mmetsp:Transcript_67440/g.161788  ORF Transcript_67440/g.161788 Transcript_67440/m.161788 type:complete len:563 (-) Transcript_67440:149-1837(-)